MPAYKSNTLRSRPEVHLPLDVWRTIMAYARGCATEVNGFGRTEVRGNAIVVIEVFILEQVATLGGVEVDQPALSRYVYDLVRQGGDPASIRFQWHSHVDMAAHFSAVDFDNMDRWLGDWLVSLVVNRAGECECQFDLYRPRLSLKVPLRVVMDIPAAVVQQTQQDMAALVKTPSRFLGRRVAAPRSTVDERLAVPPARLAYEDFERD